MVQVETCEKGVKCYTGVTRIMELLKILLQHVHVSNFNLKVLLFIQIKFQSVWELCILLLRVKMLSKICKIAQKSRRKTG